MEESILYLLISLLDRWEDNMWVDLREVGWGGVDWIYMAQDTWWAVVNTVMDLSVSLNAENFLCSWGTVSFWRKTLLLHAVSYWFPKLKISCFCPELTSLGFNVLDSSKKVQQITWFKGVCGDFKHEEAASVRTYWKWPPFLQYSLWNTSLAALLLC